MDPFWLEIFLDDAKEVICELAEQTNDLANLPALAAAAMIGLEDRFKTMLWFRESMDMEAVDAMSPQWRLIIDAWRHSVRLIESGATEPAAADAFTRMALPALTPTLF